MLLLLKPLDVYPPRVRSTAAASSSSASTASSRPRRPVNPKILKYLDDRCRVHKETINFCQDVLRRKPIDWEPILRSDLSQPLSHADLVISVGGDGTLLRASHFIDDSTPIVGVNSDPTQEEEAEEFSDEYDATRSTGYLCAATSQNFEQVLDGILEGQRAPSELTRMSIRLNDAMLSTYALNDILVAHPCPASVSRFSFRITRDGQRVTSLVNCRSSGLRVCTAAGSTAAMQSAGGFPMPILNRDLQYMVREPIAPRESGSLMMHGFMKPGQSMQTTWYSKEGVVYIDGSHVIHQVQHGDVFEISSEAPVVKVYLPQSLLV